MDLKDTRYWVQKKGDRIAHHSAKKVRQGTYTTSKRKKSVINQAGQTNAWEVTLPVSSREGQECSSTQSEEILSLLEIVTEATQDLCFDVENQFKSTQQEVKSEIC